MAYDDKTWENGEGVAAARLNDDSMNDLESRIADAFGETQPLDSDLTALAALATTAYGRALLELVDAAAGRTAFGLGTASTHAHGDYDAAGAAAAAQAASQPLDSDLTALAALATTAFGRALLETADAAAARTAISAAAATHSHAEADVTGLVADLAARQPLDSDLTALAALTTTSFGRALLELADAAAGRTALGLGTASTHAHGDYDAAGAAAAAQSASQPLDSDLTAIAALATTSFGRALLELANAGAARTALGVVIGTDVQGYDADLAAIAALTSAADKLPYATGSNAWALATLTSFARTLLDDADAATMRTTLGLDPPAWTAPTLGANWSNFGAPYNTAGHVKDAFGVVHLKGLVKSSGASDATTIFTLPVGSRPLADMLFIVSCGTAAAYCVITSAGVVKWFTGMGPGTNSWFSLENITFPAGN